LSNKEFQRTTKNNINTLIQTGTTAVGEISTHGVSPAQLQHSGLRAIVYIEIINMRSGVVGQGHSGLNVRNLSGLQTGFVRGGISPHSPYTVSESALRDIMALAAKKQLRLAMHIAESKEELRLLQRKKSGFDALYRLAGWDIDRAPHGNSSVEYLDSIGFLSPLLTAVHAIHLTDKDVDYLKKSNVSIAHCPRSNKETAVGIMPLKKYLDAGLIVGLGTDSLASSPSLNLWDEMRYAYQIHRRSGVSAKDILKLVTVNGAKALGMEHEIGTLEPGKKADIIAIPLPRKATNDIYSDLLRETKTCNMSMVNGKVLHRDGI
jgi:cytosine/adenosine deaminase-related metal-dependent hydrolase